MTETLPDTVPDLGFNVDENGWKVRRRLGDVISSSTFIADRRVLSPQAIISPRVPSLTSKAVPDMYKKLLVAATAALDQTPSLPFLSAEEPASTLPSSLDWLIHPGGASILAKIEHSLQLKSSDHTRASWEVYTRRGNTSSVSIGAVIERSRALGGREGCVGVSFGPGVTVEGCLLRRTGWKGRQAESNGGMKVEVEKEPVSPLPAVGAKRKRGAAGDTSDEEEAEMTVEVAGKKRSVLLTNGHAKEVVNGNGSNGVSHTSAEAAKLAHIEGAGNGNIHADRNKPGKHEGGVINGEVNGIISAPEGFSRDLNVGETQEKMTTVP